jgi:Protein of unknown function (DUF2946)
VLIAIWLVVLQAFLAGVATAQVGAMAASDPLLGAICHGSDGTGPADTTAPDANKVRHLCCEYCSSAAPVLTPPDAMSVAVPHYRPTSQLSGFSRFIIVLSPGAIRAGPSQAPPASA